MENKDWFLTEADRRALTFCTIHTTREKWEELYRRERMTNNLMWKKLIAGTHGSTLYGTSVIRSLNVF